MTKFILATFIGTILTLTSCTKNDDEKPSFKLEKFNSSYVQSNRHRTFLHLKGGNNSTIEYKNGKVSKVTHKNSIIKPLGISGFVQSGIDEYYEIVYSGNQVVLTKKVDHEKYTYTPKVIKLTLDNRGKIVKRINCNEKDTTDYYYSEKGYLTKSISRNGGFSTVSRNFIFDSNKNLIKIKGKIDNKGDNDYYIYEYFEAFDTGINGFASIGIVEGAFIRSLSQNNFNIYSCARYDNKNVLQDTMRLIMPVKYDENNHPIYGDTSM